MNPHSKPLPGTYKGLIIKGLTIIGREDDADKVRSGSLQFGIVATFTGNVKRIPEMTDVCIKALESIEQTNDSLYYIYALKNNDVMPVSPDGAFVYHETDEKAVAFVKDELRKDDEKVFGSGELYFNS